MAGRESAAPTDAGPPGGAAFWRLLPRHLSAAWLGAALPYLADLRTLPEPVIAFVVSTGIATAGAVIATVQRTATTDEPPDLVFEEPVPEQPAVRPGLLDVTAYPAAAPDETQCPRCGSFTVNLTATAPDVADARCRNCGTEWRQEPCAPPDVAVRSWLYH
jgi:hypothetical protein